MLDHLYIGCDLTMTEEHYNSISNIQTIIIQLFKGEYTVKIQAFDSSRCWVILTFCQGRYSGTFIRVLIVYFSVCEEAVCQRMNEDKQLCSICKRMLICS